jgi:signal transduction histidine kinase
MALAGTPHDPDELREILDDIIDEDKRAGEVIKRLRDLLRKGDAERALLDLNLLLEDVVRLLGSDPVMRGLSLRLELAPERLPVRADRVQIQQVVLNLVINAMEAVAERDRLERLVVVRSARTPAGAGRVSVEDTGPGLRDGAKERLFEPFFTTKAGGMGMGLAIARSIVQAHGGTMAARDNPGRGATFSFDIPLAANVSAMAADGEGLNQGAMDPPRSDGRA